MWIVFGNKTAMTRIPNGIKVERLCMVCGETAMFYEKELKSTFRLYFIDVFDYRKHRVMACGCCGASYATDELGVRDTPGASATGDEPLLGERFDRAAQQAGGYLERAANAVADGVTSMFSSHGASSDRRPPPPAPPRREVETDSTDDIDIDADDPMEKRFRELERKAREEGN
jgi:hypothetical protein